MKGNFVTKKGYEEYLKLLRKKEAEYQEHLKKRSEYGINTSDNYRSADFDIKRNALAYDISELKETISKLKIIKEEKQDDSIINVDDVVTIKLKGEESQKVKIVGGVPDLDREDGIICITINSPLGGALYKKKVGDTVSYTVNKLNFEVDIMAKEAELNDEESENLEK